MPVTLLLADDSATIQRVIEMTFADEDVRVVTVDDGGEAMERIAVDAPDIILADADMPEKDGYDVSAFVKADRALSHIPVVLLTGAFDPVDDERAREVGCDAVMVKPLEPKAVINRVHELLGAPAGAAAASPETAVGDGGPGPAGEAAVPDVLSETPEAPTVAAEPAGVPAGGAGAPDASPAVPEASSEGAEPAASAAPESAVPEASASEMAAPGGSSPASEMAASGVSPAAPEMAAPGASSPVSAASAPAAPEARPAAPEARPAASGTGGSPVPTDRPGAAVPAVAAVEAPPPPTLADAFAALLAAEQGDVARARAAYPWPRRAPDDEELVERVAERVVERLSEDVTGELVSEVVARVAERLVRDQIGRIEPV